MKYFFLSIKKLFGFKISDKEFFELYHVISNRFGYDFSSRISIVKKGVLADQKTLIAVSQGIEKVLSKYKVMLENGFIITPK